MKPPINRNRRNINTGIFIFGVTITLCGIISFCLKAWIMELITTSLLVLKPDHVIESYWRKIHNISTDVYLFDWMNPEDFHNISIKPRFEQVGPYKFNQSIEKVDVIWNKNNTVTYGQHRHVHFQDDIPNGNLSRRITTFNFISLLMSHYMRNENYFLKKLASAYIATSVPGLKMTISPQEMFIDGIEHYLFDVARYFPYVYPELPRYDKFSTINLLKDYKALEGIINMGSGVDGIFNVHSWNFNNILPYLNASCAQVHGTAGELNSRNISKQYVGVFLPAICRYARIDFEKEVLVDGIAGYKYSAGAGLLDNGTLVPGNECYCGGDCLPSGVLNMSICHYGLPFFGSLPHFYGADPVYVDSVEGLNPNKDKHESYVVIEPTTGIIIKAVATIQVNVRIRPVKYISEYENVREMIFPFAWVQQRCVLPDHILSLFKIYLMFPSILTGIASVLTIVGLILICISFIPILNSWFNNLHGRNQRILSTQEQVPLKSSDTIYKDK